MALYTVSTSGNLEFAYTGLGNPVSTFSNEGIATGAIASSPIAGNNAKIYTIGPPNFFTSSGGLVAVPLNLSTQNGLAASAIGEFPISGIVDNIPEVQVTLAFVTTGQQSRGNLVISGSTVSNRAWFRDSEGELVQAGTTVIDIDLIAQSTGNLVVSGSTVSSTLFNELSAGNLSITADDSTIINLATTSAGNLVIAGETTEIQAWNKQSSGNLAVVGNTVVVITLQPVSLGNLVVTDFGYGNSLFTGGIAADPLSSQAIASGNQANVVTAQISFYGNIESKGNLVISPVGEFVEPLSDSGVLAGDSLASQPIGGGMDTIFRGTGYQTTVNLSTHGNLVLSGGVYVEYQSSGNLVITGTTEQNNTVSKNTAGDLVVTGESTITSTSTADSSGNLLILGNSEFNKVVTISSSGNLLINGSSNGQTYNVSSAGNLIATGLSVVLNTVNIDTSGNLVVTGVSSRSVTSARDSLGNLIVLGSATYQVVLSVESTGILTVVGNDAYNSTTITNSSGDLEITGASASEFVPAGSVESSGNLVVTGTTLAVFVPGSQPVKQSGGGSSYVFASSWDILKPYFPDDRHILGYVRGESNGTRRRKISGSTTFTVIRGLDKPTTLSKNYDFLRSLPKVVVDSPQSLSEECPNESVLTQILYEDQLLLDNQWGEFDLINDELNYETK